MGACKSCGEHIIFAKTANGKTMPLDDTPNLTKGNVHLVQDGPKILATVLGKDAAEHCPQGHPYSTENTYVYPTGNRRCRVCRRDAHRRHEQKRTA